MEFLTAVQASRQAQGIEEHASVQALRELLSHHYAVAKATANSTVPEQQLEPQQGLQQLVHARQEVLDNLMHKLDVAVTSLGDILDDVPDQQPQQPDPQEVLAYAHRLRLTTFAKMGTFSLPPAPQAWQWAASTLYRFTNQQAALQAQQAAAATAAAAAQQVQGAAKVPAAAAPTQAHVPAAPAPAYQEGYTLQDGTALPVVQDAAPQVAAPAAPAPVAVRAAAGIDLGLILNPDMEEVSYTESDEESDDEFI